MAQEWTSSRVGKNTGTLASKKKPIKKPKKAAKKTPIKPDAFLEQIVEIGEEINEGLGASAEESILHLIDSNELAPEQSAQVAILSSRAFEVRGNNSDALKSIEYFIENNLPDFLSKLPEDIHLELEIQHASAQLNLDKVEDAVSTIERVIERLDDAVNPELLASALLVRARAYNLAGEFEIADRDAEKALKLYRDSANWRGMAWAYHSLGVGALAQAQFQRAKRYFELALQIIGENNAPVVLARVFADLGTTNWMLNNPKQGVEDLLKAVELFNLSENRFRLLFAYNDLGVSLMQIGDFPKAEATLRNAVEIAEEFDHPHIAGIYDSLGEFYLLRNDYKAAREHLNRAIEEAEKRETPWYKVPAMRNLSRISIADKKYKIALEEASAANELAQLLEDEAAEANLEIIRAEAFLGLEEYEKAKRILRGFDSREDFGDFYILGMVQRLRGEIEFAKESISEARQHFRKALTIFETRNDAYNRAAVLELIGDTFRSSDLKQADKHYVSASEIFRKLGVKQRYNKIEVKIREVNDPKRKKAVKKLVSDAPLESVRTQLLMQRLAESTASRELVFRELIAILRQESKASRIIIADLDEEDGLKPFITHDFTPIESNAMVAKLDKAISGDMLPQFVKENNAKVYELNPRNAASAVLLIAPKRTAVLKNGGALEPLLKIVELGLDVCALRDRDRDETVEEEANPFVSQSVMPGFIHSSRAMTKLVEEIYRIRTSDVTVLITGESGTGKELVARAVHSVSTRKENVFVPFNCTAVPKELTEGHLFGYKRGAFTGAANDSPGMIKTAHGGTLLLDEIGDLPIDVQPKLLRFLQEGEIQPLGERKPIEVDVRVVAATNMDLEERVKKGLFREDLFYRLNVIRLKVPPLRDRRSEVKPMVMYYLNHYSQRFNKKDVSIKPEAIDLLMVSDWEGNVRQLCNEVQRIVARAEDGDVITPDHISPELRKKPVQTTFDESGNVTPLMSDATAPGSISIGMEGATIEEAVSELESQMILDSMRRNDGNITRVSKELGLTRRGLYMKIDRYGIKRAS